MKSYKGFQLGDTITSYGFTGIIRGFYLYNKDRVVVELSPDCCREGHNASFLYYWYDLDGNNTERYRKKDSKYYYLELSSSEIVFPETYTTDYLLPKASVIDIFSDTSSDISFNIESIKTSIKF